MNTEDLNQLSDAELSEVFAMEVAGFILFAGNGEPPMSRLEVPEPWCYKDRKGTFYIGEPYSTGAGKLDHGLTFGYMWSQPSFATSADAVLPWLNTAYIWRAVGGNDEDRKSGPQCYVGVSTRDAHHSNNLVEGEMEIEAIARTFARAACIALVLAKRKASK